MQLVGKWLAMLLSVWGGEEGGGKEESGLLRNTHSHPCDGVTDADRITLGLLPLVFFFSSTAVSVLYT